jgi:hypothetical protein
MRISLLIVLFIRLAGPMIFCSGADALTIAWGDLKNTVANRPVDIEIEKEKVLRGVVVDQDGSGLRLNVESTKPRGIHKPFEVVRVERDTITRVVMIKNPTRTKGRAIGTVLGFFLGASLGAAAGGGEQNAGGVIGMVAGPVIGYYTGKSFDKESVEIHFLDTQPAAPPAANAGSPRAALPEYLQVTPAR